MIVYPSEMKASWAFKGLQKGGFTKILVIALHHNAEFDFLGKMRNVVDANVKAIYNYMLCIVVFLPNSIWLPLHSWVGLEITVGAY
jgi:hypothetical protein